MKTIYLDTIDSTNTYAKEHANEFPKDTMTCINAEEQTKGRGRFQRSWISPKGVNLYATFYFTLPKTTLHLISLSQVMAMSLVYLLQKKGLKPEIKWPNDIRLSEKKLAGILSEIVFHQETVECFIGIGINVNLSAESLKNIDQPATSLNVETDKNWDRKELLKELQDQFANDLLRFKKEGFAPFHDEFEDLLALKGKTIRCFDGEKIWEGICHSITEEGQLNIALEDGSMHTVLSGDIKSS